MAMDSSLAVTLAATGLVAFMIFDVWRTLSDDDFFGRPWPRANRQSQPGWFFALLAFRGFCIVCGLVVIVMALQSTLRA